MRTSIEILKHLVRLEYETKIISSKKYLDIEERLVELSKMSLGWERHTKQKYHT
jgi:thermostable 8-oxoguanine DNA glycosylase